MINAYGDLKIMQILNTKDESELCLSISLTEQTLSNCSLRGELKKAKLIYSTAIKAEGYMSDFNVLNLYENALCCRCFYHSPT